ncbi:MAG: Hsp70 family protein [Lachnospiraceae bacterium]|nr:Hsp70 family protein [Lachnospiraceae bacterium]
MGTAIIGIDLGTSTTEAAVIRDGKPVMIVNMENEVITPSAVGLDAGGNWVVGEKARAQYLLSPNNTAIEVKRKIGTNEEIRLGRQFYTPVKLSAKLLEYVKTYASEYLEEEVTRAVISVPAYFDDIQRQATVKAGMEAGLQVERIINEPTAAALSYGLEHMEEESHILVYDLGGGTFDVTLLEMFDGVLEVKASNGDNQLGGKDFDEKLMDLLNGRFMKKHGVDLRKNTYAMVKLKEEAERCKKTLSTQPSCHVLVPMIIEKGGQPLALDEMVTVEQFEEIVQELLNRTHRPIDVVLADSGVMPSEIDRVILVGGSTRMPIVTKDIHSYLNIMPSQAVNPDFAVAEGAAIQAGMIQGSIRSEDGIIMTDVNPYTLGIRAMDDWSDDCMSVVIPRNVTIPATRSHTYYTSWDGQTEAHIEVYQGESDIASSNHFLGDFVVRDIPFGKAGKEKIGVQFSYNMNGMLEVKASILSNGAEAAIEINMLQETDAAEERIDVSKWKDSPIAKQFRTVIRRGERALKNPQIQYEPFLTDELESSLYYLKKAIVMNDPEEAEEAEEELMDILEDLE